VHVASLLRAVHLRYLVHVRGRSFPSRLRPDPISHSLAAVHLFSEVKQMGCEAEQLPLSNVAAGNTGSYTVTPAYIFKTWGLIQQIYIGQINNIFSKVSNIYPVSTQLLVSNPWRLIYYDLNLQLVPFDRRLFFLSFTISFTLLDWSYLA